MRTTSGAIGTAFGAFVVGCALSACASGMTGAPGDDDDHGGGGGVDGGAPPMVAATALSIDPPSCDLVIDNGAAAHQKFTATATFADGTKRDVTSETRFQVDPAHGAFTGPELAIGTAGKTVVIAAYANQSATAAVTARIRVVRIDPSLPPTAVSLFTGADSGLAPEIVYPAGPAPGPAPDLVMPRNLGDFEVHWIDRHGHDVFEISLHTEFTDVRVYVPGGNGLVSRGPMASWAAFRADEWLTAVGSQSAVTFGVRGASSIGPAGPGAAPVRTVKLSNQAMDGGLYYWATATAATAIGIFRHDMQKPGQPAEEFLTTRKTDGHCIGCHVLSRDGTRMAITYQDLPGPPGFATIVDVAKGAIAPAAMSSNFGAFTPDNTQFLSVEHGVLSVHDTATQAELATMPTTPPKTWITHPDLSADGKKLVYVRAVLWESDWNFKQGQIYMRTYDQATRTFGPEQPVVADDTNNYYPTWSPDGNWILFTRGGTDPSYDNNNSTVWVVKADRSQPPLPLAAANEGFGITDSWARWAPFQQTLGSPEEPMFWITMSSKRDFGVRLRNTGLPQRGDTGKRAQLWMTPFFPGRAAQGIDPSLPVFRLPFQNLDSSNHIAQWTERVVQTPVIE